VGRFREGRALPSISGKVPISGKVIAGAAILFSSHKLS
jgi:hypothetical protein